MICAIDSRGNGLDFDPPVYLSFPMPAAEADYNDDADVDDDDHVDALLEIEFVSMYDKVGMDDYSDQYCPYFPRAVMSCHPSRQMY